jgi:hypothetical protein
LRHCRVPFPATNSAENAYTPSEKIVRLREIVASPGLIDRRHYMPANPAACKCILKGKAEIVYLHAIHHGIIRGINKRETSRLSLGVKREPFIPSANQIPAAEIADLASSSAFHPCAAFRRRASILRVKLHSPKQHIQHSRAIDILQLCPSHQKASQLRSALFQKSIVALQNILGWDEVPANLLLARFESFVAVLHKMFQAQEMKIESQHGRSHAILRIAANLPYHAKGRRSVHIHGLPESLAHQDLSAFLSRPH